jgi:adenylate kinase family enzyme
MYSGEDGKFDGKKYREVNREKINSRMQSYREKNKEVINIKSAIYHEKNKEIINAKRRLKYLEKKNGSSGVNNVLDDFNED